VNVPPRTVAGASSVRSSKNRFAPDAADDLRIITDRSRQPGQRDNGERR
jgi:hypothetical protein